QAVVGRVRGGEGREDVLAVALHPPVELPAVDQDAGEGRAVPAEVLGGGGDHHVSTQLQRADEGGGRHGVVDDERDLVAVRDLGDGRDVQDVVERVRDRLAVEELRVGTHGRLPRGGVVRVLDER